MHPGKGKLLLGENMGISLVNNPTFRPIEGAFVIPFEQLQLGPIIAAGAQGQVRKGFFSGNAVAIKELIASLFDPEETEALKVWFPFRTRPIVPSAKRPLLPVQEEATMLSSLHHPNIVRFYGMAIDASAERGASYFLVTDLKDGDLRFERIAITKSFRGQHPCRPTRYAGSF